MLNVEFYIQNIAINALIHKHHLNLYSFSLAQFEQDDLLIFAYGDLFPPLLILLPRYKQVLTKVIFKGRMKQVIGIILAGGKSRRMGQDKSAMLFKGQSLLQNMLSTLSQTEISEIVINTHSSRCEQKDQALAKYTCIEDIIPDKGPLSGIHSALVNFPDANLLVVPVDIPLMTSNSLNTLISTAISHGMNCRFAPYSVNTQESEARHSNLPLFIHNSSEVLPILEQILLRGQSYSVFNFCKRFPIYEVPVENDIELSNFNYPWQMEG
jgi:molybdopterin-guanine dinucleotide biosynthesis protein A